MTVFIATLGLGFLARFQQGKWMNMRVIEHTRPELEGHPLIDESGAHGNVNRGDIAEPDDDVLESAVR